MKPPPQPSQLVVGAESCPVHKEDRQRRTFRSPHDSSDNPASFFRCWHSLSVLRSERSHPGIERLQVSQWSLVIRSISRNTRSLDKELPRGTQTPASQTANPSVVQHMDTVRVRFEQLSRQFTRVVSLVELEQDLDAGKSGFQRLSWRKHVLPREQVVTLQHRVAHKVVLVVVEQEELPLVGGVQRQWSHVERDCASTEQRHTLAAGQQQWKELHRRLLLDHRVTMMLFALVISKTSKGFLVQQREQLGQGAARLTNPARPGVCDHEALGLALGVRQSHRGDQGEQREAWRDIHRLAAAARAWEQGSAAETWRALEDMRARGVVRDIGVSNFGIAHLEKLALTAKVPPAVNQVELHPWLARKELVGYCTRHGILVEAYSPLSKGKMRDSEVLKEIADQAQATPAQVLIAHSLAKGYVAIPKSVDPARQQENLDASVKVALTAAQIETLDALDEHLVCAWDPSESDEV